MSVPKRHHFVPQMLLRRFTNSAGQLFYFDKRTIQRGVRVGKPDDLFFSNHLYSAVDSNGSKDPALEIYFSRIESEAGPVITRIVEAAQRGTAPRLDVREREIWVRFLYYQWKRAPDLYESVWSQEGSDQTIDSSIAEFERRVHPLTHQQRTHFQDARVREQLRNDARIGALHDPGTNLQSILAGMGFVVGLVPKPTKSLIIGSNPVVKLSHPGRHDLRNPEVELWLPVASDVAVIMTGVGEHFIQLEDLEIRTFNQAAFNQSTLVASRSPDLMKSLTRNLCRGNPNRSGA